MDWNKEFMQAPGWKEEIINREEKERLAKIMAKKLTSGDVVGFGSGSTSYLTAIELHKRAGEEGLDFTAIPTSYEMQMLCDYLGIKTASLLEKKPDWCFDGADEVDYNHNMIKGRGSQMYKEKLNIASSGKTYILVDESKMVNKLGEKFPIPVEIIPNALNYVKEHLYRLGANEMKLRLAVNKDGPVITENGNFIVDCRFNEIKETLEKDLKQITGVVESGLFLGYNIEVIR